MITIMLVLVAQCLWAGTKIFPLQGINKPGQLIYMDKDHLYAIEDASVFIYSVKDFKLVKKFGKKGQGPQEFATSAEMGAIGQLSMDVQTDRLMVRCVTKISWFTKDGKFITEQKLPPLLLLQLIPFGKNYIGQKYEAGNIRYNVLAAYNEKFEQLKEFSRHEDQFQLGKGLKVLKDNLAQVVYKDKLYMAWENELKIKVIDTNFKELLTITYPQKRTKVTAQDQKEIIELIKTSPETKQYFELLKPITFPDYYPAIMQMFVTGDKVYVMTFNTQEEPNKGVNKYETLVFDLKGKFVKTFMCPTKMQDPLRPYPMIIHEGKLYQLIENEDDESWEVHITDL